MRCLPINKTVNVNVHSNLSDYQIMDDHGDVHYFETAVRVVYQEAESVVVLDATHDTCVLRRKGEWITTCYFSLEKSWIQIQSDEGNLNFDVIVKEMSIQDGYIQIVYDLNHGNEIESFNYTCTWKKEGILWPEVH